MCTTSLLATIQIDSAMPPVRVFKRKTFARSFVSAAANVKTDSPVADARPSATPNSVLATWQFASAILISVRLVEQISSTSLKSHARTSAFNEDYVSLD